MLTESLELVLSTANGQQALQHALQDIKDMRSNGDFRPVKLLLQNGKYRLDSPLLITSDIGTNLTITAFPGDTPVLDGGRRITNWETATKDGRELWIAKLPTGTYFKQLFINGVRRSRTRLPKVGYYWMEEAPDVDLTKHFMGQLYNGADTFRFAEGHIDKAWRNITDIDIIVDHAWLDERMPIKSVDSTTNTVQSTKRSVFVLKDDVVERYSKYYLENVYEAMSEPGQWYMDRAQEVLYYMPLPGETMEETEVIYPSIKQFIRVEGDPTQGKWIDSLHIEGLTFRHADWEKPEITHDYEVPGFDNFDMSKVNMAATPQGAVHVPGAIVWEGVRNSTIEKCTIEHIGYYGIELGDGCTDNRIADNTILDMGAGGIKLGGTSIIKDAIGRTGRNQITDNHIHDGSHVFHSSCGIISIHTFGNQISHNHIHDLYYIGISCGWVWGYRDNVSKDNLIECNYIHDIGKGVMSDLGGIYTLGVQPGTVIKGNVIHHVTKRNYGGWGIYLDEGSSHMLVEGNLCCNTSSQGFHQHYGRENIVRNNIFVFGEEGQVALSRADEHIGFTFERNIVVGDGQPIYFGGYSGQLEKKNIIADLNVLWDLHELGSIGENQNPDHSQNKKLSWEQWQGLGYDAHSVLADPCFINIQEMNFTLTDNSPAFLTGFKPIDFSKAGPRTMGKKVSIEERLKLAGGRKNETI
ncbi:MAG: right-handed parallel beta-helix repeat-containing protein [Gorillibacterium sp.]|nr:right-handed parallel beta-helix repeat-containing protein [Gorillibacterium sp.]